MANRNEHAVRVNVSHFAGFDVFELRACHAERHVCADDFIQNRIPDHLCLRVLHEAVLEDFLTAQGITAVNQRNLGCEVCEVECLFDSCVAAANDDDFFLTIEEAVARRTRRDAEAFELLFCRQAEPFGLCAGRNDHDVSGEFLAGVRFHLERANLQVDFGNLFFLYARAHRFGVFAHFDHQVRTLNFFLARPVFDLCGDSELAARLIACEDERIAHSTSCIDCGCIACRACTNDDYAFVLNVAHVSGLHKYPKGSYGDFRGELNPSERSTVCIMAVIVLFMAVTMMIAAMIRC